MATADWASMLARPSAQPNAVSSFARGQNDQLDANTKLQAQNKEAFQQAVSMTVEALVAKSIDDRGNFDPETYAMLARQTPFGASAMQAGLAQVLSQRKAAAESAQAGNTMLASGVDQASVFPKAAWRSAPPTSLNPSASAPGEGQERRALPGMPGYSNTDPRAPVRRPVAQSSKLAPAIMSKSGFDVAGTEGALDGGRSVKGGTMVAGRPEALEGDPASGSAESLRALQNATFDEQAGPNTMSQIQHIQTSRPDATAMVPKRTAQSVANASAAQRQEWVRGLRGAGIDLPPDNVLTNEDIANGLNAAATARVRAQIAGMNPDKPGESLASASSAANQAESLANQTAQELGEKGRGMKGERLGQAATAQSTAFSGQTRESIERARHGYAKDLQLDPDRLGPAGSPEAAETGRELQTRGGQYQALAKQVEEIVHKLPELNKPTNKKLLDQEIASLTRLVNQVAGGSAAAHSMDQSMQEIGGPTNLFAANGVGEGFRILLTNGTPQQQARLIGALPAIIFRNTLGTDYRGFGGDPDSWKKRLDSEIAKPSKAGVSDPVRHGGKAPKVGETNAKGQTWTGKRWL